LAFLPVAGIFAGMNNANHNQGVLNHHEVNTIGKAVDENTSDLPMDFFI
jgi:hypothetical protein